MNYCKKRLLFIFSFSMALIMMQSCWKDKSLKDKDISDIHLDITPGYGVPLANLHLTGGDIVKQFVKNDSSANFRIEFDPSQNDIGIIIYDRIKQDLSLPATLSDTTMEFSINYFSDLRIAGLTVKEAFVNVNVLNGYTKDITFIPKKIEYEKEDRTTESVAITSNTDTVKRALSDGAFTYTRLFKSDLLINNPLDIVYNGRLFRFSFGLSYDSLTNTSKVNLNPIVRVPMYFSLVNHLRYDTVGTTLKDMGVIYNDTSSLSLNNVTIYLTVINGLPMDIKLQTYFADANYKIIDSLQTTEMHVRPAETYSNFLLQNQVIDEFEVSMSRERFKKLENTKYIIFKEILNSKNQDDVKIFKSNTLGIKLSIKVDGKISGTLDDIKNDLK